MKEKDYLDVSNLAKLRIANSVLRDCLFHGTENDLQKETVSQIDGMISRIEKRIVK